MTARQDYPFPAAVADGRVSGGAYGQAETAAALDEIDGLRDQARRYRVDAERLAMVLDHRLGNEHRHCQINGCTVRWALEEHERVMGRT